MIMIVAYKLRYKTTKLNHKAKRADRPVAPNQGQPSIANQDPMGNPELGTVNKTSEMSRL
ncbi:hypothetical protein H6F46_13430 [Limnothrix sp. FACHB-1083]|uniref:hypothetical protein n=1 Tax=Limnothrix sp. FACHB-1083 TaxID=2692815 RepID=UPI00168136FD|nr:hypothetical protein [Limnothrix sp. FACHB-1083]MBD2161695.1 hypothetical protein [Limnothrix sp. FACHB-1083]MBD2192728.1 hypothetical protein [Limnothrix sp. FACHB-1088]